MIEKRYSRLRGGVRWGSAGAGLLAIAVALLTATGMLALTKPAEAVTSTIPDGNVAALVNAIKSANGSAGPDTITLASDGTYTLTEVDNSFFGDNGLPAISSEITIEGNGAKVTRSQGGGQTPEFRLFYVASAGNLTLRDVELAGGEAVGGHGADSNEPALDGANGGGGGGAAGMGGAIFNAGTLTVERSTLSVNTAEGGFGGDFGGNVRYYYGGGGGVAGDAFAGGGNGGPGSNYNDGGCSAYAPNASCYQPGARTSGHLGGNGGPGGGGGAGYYAGEGGYGGFAGGGGGGGYQGGRGGHGGGYMVGDGGPGGLGDTGFGGGGGGGGGTPLSRGGPGVGGFGGGDGLDGAGGGGAGMGGAIFNHAGTLTITNSIVSNNGVVGGFGGAGMGYSSLIPAEDGLGLGGGLFNRNGTVTIQSSTFTNNFTTTWRPEHAANMAGGTGGGIYHLGDHMHDSPAPKLTMHGTIVANSGGIPPNGGTINDYQSYSRYSLFAQEGTTNLIESGDHSGWSNGTVAADPKLGSAYEPGPGSPAVDAAGSDCPVVDQRRVARPQDGDADGRRFCDIGAFEVSPPPNNDFANAETVTGDDASVGGSTRAATRESGEPDHYTPVPGDSDWVGEHSVWYRWTAPYSGSATVDTCQANIDSILAVYNGDSLGSLRRVTDNNNHSDCPSGSWGSKLTFGVTAEETYRIAVGDAGGLRQNTFTLKLDLTDDASPEAPVIESPANDFYDADGAFTVSGTAEPNSTVELFDGQESKGKVAANGSGDWSKDLTGVAEGPHAYTATATDEANNTSAASETRTVTVDATAPTGSVSINDGAKKTRSLNVKLALKANDSGSGVKEMRLSKDGKSWQPWQPFASSKSWKLTKGGSATKAVYAQYRDRAGNASAVYKDTIKYAP